MSMYGPQRHITEVGEHTADGTLVTMECGHTFTCVPHMHMDPTRYVGQLHPCGRCKTEEPETTKTAGELFVERYGEDAVRDMVDSHKP